MKIYTRTGDEGKTSLIYGRRIDKDSLRVEAYGTVDEANSVIGVALASVPPDFADIRKMVERVQRDLFDVGRDLATPLDKQDGFFVGSSDVELLEKMIDRVDAQNAPLHQFVLPGGHPAAAAFHHARTVVRRAERCIVTLAKQEPVNPTIRNYLNRLSDFMFVLARVLNTRTHHAEPGVDFKAEKIDPFGDAE